MDWGEECSAMPVVSDAVFTVCVSAVTESAREISGRNPPIGNLEIAHRKAMTYFTFCNHTFVYAYIYIYNKLVPNVVFDFS